MNKNIKIPVIIAALALIISGCGKKPQASSIINGSIEANTSITSEESNLSSAISSEYSDSEAASEIIISSDDNSSVAPSSQNSSAEASSSASSSSASSSAAQSSSASSSSSSISYSVPPVEEDSRWNINLSLRGAEFRNALQTIMAGKKTVTTTYSNCLSVGAKAAAYPNADSSTFVPFYHDATVTTTTSSCNREHTWPNSRGTGETGPGADPFIIRPTLKSENSDRQNYFYGTGGKSNKEWDPASCGFEASRGESARVILYCATMYYKNGFSLSNNPSSTPHQRIRAVSGLLRGRRNPSSSPERIFGYHSSSVKGYHPRKVCY